MTSLLLWRQDSRMNGFDPRVRLVVGFVLCVLLAISKQPNTVLAGLFFGALAAVTARLPWRGLWIRWVGLNLFMLMLLIVLPWSMPGTPLWTAGPFVYSREGLYLALLVMGKGNAILLVLSAWISTIDLSALGHALEHLCVPRKLVHVFLFTVRYLEVLVHEQRRLFRAARARGFVARADRHTYRTLARLVGMLLFRGLARSERVLMAMKARGYNGHFYLLHHFTWHGRDAAFACVALVMAASLSWLEWNV